MSYLIPHLIRGFGTRMRNKHIKLNIECTLAALANSTGLVTEHREERINSLHIP